MSRVQDGRWPAMDGWFLPSGWCYKGKDGGILRDDSKSEVEICPYFLLINHYKRDGVTIHRYSSFSLRCFSERVFPVVKHKTIRTSWSKNLCLHTKSKGISFEKSDM